MSKILRTSLLTVSLVTSLASLAACGGAVGETLRPQDQTATSALGTKGPACASNPKYAKPLIVDLDPDARVDLEAAMKKGVVVVSYDCSNLRVLTGCKGPEAGYEYAGVSRKEQVVQMNSMDDLNVNLPLSSAKLSGEVKSGRSIDLALVLVGRRTTTVAKVARDDLSGSCEGATHYLQNATLGAFSMATGSIGKAAVVADLFNRGGSASSNSERKAMNMDGSLDSCRTSDPDSTNPPTECRAPLRVELIPITGETAPVASEKGPKSTDKEEKDKEKTTQAQENPCPDGYLFIDGICTKKAAQPYLCNPKNESECQEQCGKGNAPSCYNYARLVRKKSGWKEALPYYKKGCDGEVADACAEYGNFTLPDTDESKNIPAETAAAVKYMAIACKAGSALGCEYIGDTLSEKSYQMLDKAIAAKAYDRGCSLGRGMSCWSLAMMYFKGDTVAQDSNKGVALLTKACKGGSADECSDLGDVWHKGQYGLPKDEQKAFAAYHDACELDTGWCSDAVKSALAIGNDGEAFRLGTHGCNGNDEETCYRLGLLYEAGKGTSADPAKAKAMFEKACNKGDGEEGACKKIGVKMKD